MRRSLCLATSLLVLFGAGCGRATDTVADPSLTSDRAGPLSGSRSTPAADTAPEPISDRSKGDNAAVPFTLDGAIQALAFAPDGKLLALGRGNGVVLWDTTARMKRATWQGHQSDVEAVTYSPDGTLLASSGGQDGTIIVWDTATGKQRVSFKVPSATVVCSNVAFSPDARVVAAGYGDGTIRTWDLARGEGVMVLQGYPANHVAYAADGKTLASSGSTGTVQLWDAATGKRLVSVQGPLQRSNGRVSAKPLRSVALAADGKTMATECDDPAAKTMPQELDEKTVFLWDLPPNQPRATLRGHSNDGRAMAFSPDGKLLALAAEEGTREEVRHVVKLWDTAGGREVATVGRHQDAVQLVAFSPTGKALATSDGNEVKVWAVAAGQSPAAPTPAPAPPAGPPAPQGHTAAVYAVAFSPDGKTLASGSEDGTIKLWDVSTGKEQATIDVVRDAIRGVAFSPDGGTLASANVESKSVKLWDVATRKERGALQGHFREVLSVAYSPDGKLLASGSRDLTARLWDVGTGKPLATLAKQTTEVRFVVFSPDGKTLATPSQWEVNLYDVATGQLRGSLKGHRDTVMSAAFGPDGQTLVSGSLDRNKPVLLWDTATGKAVGMLKADLDEVTALALSPDGKVLATGGKRYQDGKPHIEVTLWEVATGKELAAFQWHTVQVTAVAFSPDGKTLASASYDKTVKFWDVARALGR